MKGKGEESPRTPNGHNHSYTHQNSNQNLYNKEVFIKFPHNNMGKRVLMKVQGDPSRRKHVSSIPRKGQQIDEVDGESDLPDKKIVRDTTIQSEDAGQRNFNAFALKTTIPELTTTK